MTKDVRPFLASIASPTRPLGAALRKLETPPVTSPWSPAAAVAEPAVALPTEAEIAEVFDDARERGREEGLAETAALRARLAALVVELATARASIIAPAAELVAEVATCVIEAWTEHTRREDTFGPLIREWVDQSSGQPAQVRVHPGDVAAVTEAVGGAEIAIVGDPAIAPGAIEIRGAALELSHDWRNRLPDLRTAIAGALTGTLAADEPEAP
jgi:flagellar biosynthesis/type III secretory pathway protein FliH